VEECDQCGHCAISYNSCRNRSCPKCQAAARAKWLAEGEAELLPVEQYFHVVFTLPQQIAKLALAERQARLHDPLPRRFRNAVDHRGGPQAPGHCHWLSGHSPHLGTEPTASPSLMMHGIIISFVFSEQSCLIFRTAPAEH
jgi:hypothetical protein